MPKAAHGSAKSPATGGSARTNQSQHEARSAATEGTESTEPDATTSTEALKTEPNTEPDSGPDPGPDSGTKTDAPSDAKTDAKGDTTTRTGTPESATAKSGSSTKTAALTRTTPLRTGAVDRKGKSGKSGRSSTAVRPRTAAPAPSPARRLSARLKAWGRRVPAWWPLPLCLVLGAGGGGAYSAATPSQYAAISYVVVSTSGGQPEPTGALGYAQAYGKIATDPVILADAERRAHLRRGTIRPGIQASTSPDAPMVQITATSSDAAQAAKNADAVAKALTHTAKTSVKLTGARLTVLSDAVAPPTPVSPSPAVAVGVGACAGGLIGGLVLLVRPRPRREPMTATPTAGSGHGRDEAAATADATTTATTAAATTGEAINSATEQGR